MSSVWIPALMRDLTGKQETVHVAGTTLLEVIDDLDTRFPGIKARLCQGDELRQGLAVVIDTQVIRDGLSATVGPNSEVHFIPAVSGG